MGKMIHTFDHLTPRYGLSVYVGSGLTMSKLCDASKFFGVNDACDLCSNQCQHKRENLLATLQNLRIRASSTTSMLYCMGSAREIMPEASEVIIAAPSDVST